MISEVVIPEQFRGPPSSGNGGYVAGVLAEHFPPPPAPGDDGAAVEVTLRSPIPLDTPMRLECVEEGQLRLMLAEQLIAEARRTHLALEVPSPPGFAAALAARADSPSFYRDVNPLVKGGTGFHPVCVCCGADVAEDRGLHVYAAPVPGFDGVAAAWRAKAVFAGPDGHLPERLVWTALDCPGQFAYMAAGIRTGLLGRMTARVLRPVPAETDLVIIGWRIGIERKKHFAGTALFDDTGELCAWAQQTWIGRV